jgi:hypothetical protein
MLPTQDIPTLPSLSSPLQLLTTQSAPSLSHAEPTFTFCNAAGGCPWPTTLTPIKPAVAHTSASPAQPPVALQTIVQAPPPKAVAPSKLNVSFAYLSGAIDAKQRAEITRWVQQQIDGAGHRDINWDHYRLLVHFTHQGRSSQRLAEARAKAVIGLLNSLGLHGVPVTALTDGIPHRVVGITHFIAAPATTAAPFALSPHSAPTSPTASAAGAASRRGESAQR